MQIERENAKKAQEVVSYYKEELSAEKDKIAKLELDLQKKENRYKDMNSKFIESDKKNEFKN